MATETKPHLDLVLHGELDGMSLRELRALRRTIIAAERYVQRKQRHESQPYWRRFLREWLRVMWTLSFPCIGLGWWLASIYHAFVEPLLALPYVQVALAVARGLLTALWPW